MGAFTPRALPRFIAKPSPIPESEPSLPLPDVVANRFSGRSAPKSSTLRLDDPHPSHDSMLSATPGDQTKNSPLFVLGRVACALLYGIGISGLRTFRGFVSDSGLIPFTSSYSVRRAHKWTPTNLPGGWLGLTRECFGFRLLSRSFFIARLNTRVSVRDLQLAPASNSGALANPGPPG